MKFGEQIKSQMVPVWAQYYVDYDGAKNIIESLVASANSNADGAFETQIGPAASLSVPRPTDASGMPLPLHRGDTETQAISHNAFHSFFRQVILYFILFGIV